MEMVDPRTKYRFHDIHVEDISDYDFRVMKSTAVDAFVREAETDNFKIFADQFMRYLTSRGYRIVKEKND